jgi:teichuronic acid biosynthesis glycosyltransferase TuaG
MSPDSLQRSENRLVSIVTPVYRAEKFIGATIESVIAQDYPQWEMIVVDDHSPDDSSEVVQRYASVDPRVKLVRLAKNSGAAMARNAALEAARGRYVAFLDSDDMWLPHKLSTQLAFMDDIKAGLSFTSFRRISQSGDRTGRLIAVPAYVDYTALLKHTVIATSTVIVDTSICGTLRMRKAYLDDFVLWLELLKRGIVAHGLPLDLARYRVVQQSLSRNKKNSAQHVWRTYRQIEHLGVLRAAWCFMHYACRAWLKYRRF